MRIVVLIVVLIYIISPLDFVPGPIDDVVVGVLGVAIKYCAIVRIRNNKEGKFGCYNPRPKPCRAFGILAVAGTYKPSHIVIRHTKQSQRSKKFRNLSNYP